MLIIAGSFTFLLMGPLLMDHRRFRDDAPGTLCAIETHGGWSFIPDALPPASEFPLVAVAVRDLLRAT